MDDLVGKLDELLKAHDRYVCAEIDAGACRTSYDYRKRDEAQEKYETLREQFEEKLRQVR